MSIVEPSFAVGGMPFKLVLFFACQPDEVLTTQDIAIKFNRRADRIGWDLKCALDHGYVAIVKRGGGGPGQRQIYGPGPQLLRMLGQDLVNRRSAA